MRAVAEHGPHLANCFSHRFHNDFTRWLYSLLRDGLGTSNSLCDKPGTLGRRPKAENGRLARSPRKVAANKQIEASEKRFVLLEGRRRDAPDPLA